MSEKVLPRPCNGPLYEHWSPDDFMDKVDEEYRELAEAFETYLGCSRMAEAYPHKKLEKLKYRAAIAIEATDLITAVTSFLEALGYDERARQELQQAINWINARRDGGRRFR